MTQRERERREKKNGELALIAVLMLAALLASASCGGNDSTTAGTLTPTAATRPTQPPQAAVSTAVPGTREGASPTEMPTASVGEIVASRTPVPTPEAGPVEQAVSEAIDAAGLGTESFLGLTGDQWINLGISVLLVLLTLSFGKPALQRLLQRVVQKTATELDNRIMMAVLPQLWRFVALLVVEFAILRLDFIGTGLRTLVGDLFFILYTAIVGHALWILLDVASEWYFQRHVPEHQEDKTKTHTALTMVRRVGQIIIILLCIAVVLERFGIKITSAAAAIGLFALAVSLAAEDTVANVIGGFIIMVDRPFRVGDRVQMQDLGTWGDVMEIGTRDTRIRTLDHRMVIVPNSTIGKSQIVNFNYPDPGYRLQVEIGIRYNADINEARRIIRDAVKTVDGVEHDKPVDVLFMEFGDAAMVFRVRWWIDSYVDFYQMMDGVNGAIFEAAAAAGVDLNTIYDVNVKLDAPDVALLAQRPRTDAPSAVQPAADVDAGHF